MQLGKTNTFAGQKDKSDNFQFSLLLGILWNYWLEMKWSERNIGPVGASPWLWKTAETNSTLTLQQLEAKSVS